VFAHRETVLIVTSGAILGANLSALSTPRDAQVESQPTLINPISDS